MKKSNGKNQIKNRMVCVYAGPDMMARRAGKVQDTEITDQTDDQTHETAPQQPAPAPIRPQIQPAAMLVYAAPEYMNQQTPPANASIRMKLCAECGQPNVFTNKFCTECGHKFTYPDSDKRDV